MADSRAGPPQGPPHAWSQEVSPAMAKASATETATTEAPALSEKAKAFFAAHPMPKPTKDLEQAKRDLDDHGVCVIEDALDPEMHQRIMQRIAEQGEAEWESGHALRNTQPQENGRNQVWNLLNKGDVFLELLTHPLSEEMMSYYFKTDEYLVSSMSANPSGTAKPGLSETNPLGLHTDQGYIPAAISHQLPLAGNTIWCLDEQTVANGST